MDEQKFFETVCSKRFDDIDKANNKIIKILKGEDGNDLGLCERVRALEKIKRTFTWVGGLVIGGWILANAAAFVEWVGRLLAAKHG